MQTAQKREEIADWNIQAYTHSLHPVSQIIWGIAKFKKKQLHLSIFVHVNVVIQRV